MVLFCTLWVLTGYLLNIYVELVVQKKGGLTFFRVILTQNKGSNETSITEKNDVLLQIEYQVGII